MAWVFFWSWAVCLTLIYLPIFHASIMTAYFNGFLLEGGTVGRNGMSCRVGGLVPDPFQWACQSFLVQDSESQIAPDAASFIHSEHIHSKMFWTTKKKKKKQRGLQTPCFQSMTESRPLSQKLHSSGTLQGMNQALSLLFKWSWWRVLSHTLN